MSLTGMTLGYYAFDGYKTGIETCFSCIYAVLLILIRTVGVLVHVLLLLIDCMFTFVIIP